MVILLGGMTVTAFAGVVYAWYEYDKANPEEETNFWVWWGAALTLRYAKEQATKVFPGLDKIKIPVTGFYFAI